MFENVNKKAKPVKVVYSGEDAPKRHRGRTQKDPPYMFIKGHPVEITDPVDIEFFKMKAKNNPEIWSAVKT